MKKHIKKGHLMVFDENKRSSEQNEVEFQGNLFTLLSILCSPCLIKPKTDNISNCFRC